ncbi:MAG: hypothetical protein JO202_11540 [Ktedonobacteraceae bacterium]|nr:hypothetical protein [Ktedonobacteraceae bacterium]
MDDETEQSIPFSPSFRIWLCGAFRVERRIGTSYEVVRATEWAGSSYPRLLLKALLCCPRRQARRDALLEMLWPDADPEQAIQYLNTATSKLRKVLESSKGQASLLRTEDDYRLYRLAGQPLLWVDVDAALTSLRAVERMEGTTSAVSSLLEEALGYLDAGPFLADDDGLWLSQRRGEVEVACYNGRLRLAEVYERQGMLVQAELQLRKLLAEDPTDEDVLCCLMELLHRHGMTYKALRAYHQFTEVAQQEGLEPAEATKALAVHIRQERDSTQHITVSPIHNSVYTLPRETFVFAGSSFLQFPKHGNWSFSEMRGSIEKAIDRAVRGFENMTQQSNEGLTRRQILHLLMSAPVAASDIEIGNSPIDEVLARCAINIPLCWRLYFASGHSDVRQVLPQYLDQLALITQECPSYRTSAAEIAAQGHQLAYLLELQVQNFRRAEEHVVQAFQYGQLAEDKNLQVSALIRKGNVYFTRKWPLQTLKTYQEALAYYDESVSPLLAGQMYIGLAEAHARLNNKEATTRFTGLAHEIFPLHPESDPHFSYTHFNHFTLANFEGIALLHLHEPHQAWKIFDQIEKAVPEALVPQRVELLSRQLRTAFEMGDVERCEAYVPLAVDSAIKIASDLRYSEVCEIYSKMQEKWSDNSCIRQLADLFTR